MRAGAGELDKSKVERLVRCWHLVADGEPLSTHSGWVGFYRLDDRPVVLKVPSPESDEGGSHRILRHYGGQGAVGLLDVAEDALLLERACPGDALSGLVAAGRDDEATQIVCETMKALARPPVLTDLPTVEDWGKGFGRYRRSGDTTLPAGLVDSAEALFADLAASQGERFVLHGDLHHYNIVFDQNRGWLAIDPKGVIGELAYETGAMLRNPIEDESLFARRHIVERRIEIICNQMGFSPDRILGWAFAQLVLAVIWAIEDGHDPGRGLVTAQLLRSMLRP